MSKELQSLYHINVHSRCSASFSRERTTADDQLSARTTRNVLSHSLPFLSDLFQWCNVDAPSIPIFSTPSPCLSIHIRASTNGRTFRRFRCYVEKKRQKKRCHHLRENAFTLATHIHRTRSKIFCIRKHETQSFDDVASSLFGDKKVYTRLAESSSIYRICYVGSRLAKPSLRLPRSLLQLLTISW